MEQLPHDAPPPLGKPVVTISYTDAKIDAQYVDWWFCYRHITLRQSDSFGLVCKETEYSGDGYLWIRDEQLLNR